MHGKKVGGFIKLFASLIKVQDNKEDLVPTHVATTPTYIVIERGEVSLPRLAWAHNNKMLEAQPVLLALFSKYERETWNLKSCYTYLDNALTSHNLERPLFSH